MWDAIINGFLQQGPLGIGCVALGFAVWKQNQMLQLKDQQLQAVQEARVQDANKTVDRLVGVSQALDKNSEAMQDALAALREKR